MKRLKFVAVAVLAASVALPTTSAVAKSLTGGGVTATTPYNNDSGRISVYDGSDDGDPGKAEYYRHDSAGTKRTLWNKSGFKTTVVSGDGSAIIKFQACDENNAAPDDCSGWGAP
ncbi:hypothetical protein QWJ26_25560 [Streptomyces sp. CSDS2]|uniref:hypothetical protein n=1 Tax=Streptomyces sp. CSDS2 TaxID=3055051 RepID=UPI0025B237B0|nr:hypothetical protein [Streptomyces sp. CSDS2]MDN3263119.1 hypothetical protein [Streptomyces sp. CSDS2]